MTATAGRASTLRRLALLATLLLLGALTAPSVAEEEGDSEDPRHRPPLATPRGCVISATHPLILTEAHVRALAGSGYRVEENWSQFSRSATEVTGPSRPELIVRWKDLDNQGNRSPWLVFVPWSFIPTIAVPNGHATKSTLWSRTFSPNRHFEAVPMQTYLSLGGQRAPSPGSLVVARHWRPVTAYALVHVYPYYISLDTAKQRLDGEEVVAVAIRYYQFLDALSRFVPGMNMTLVLDEYGFYSDEFAAALLEDAISIVPGGRGARLVKGGLVASYVSLMSYQYANAESDEEKIAAVVNMALMGFEIASIAKRSGVKANGGPPPTPAERQVYDDLIGTPPPDGSIPARSVMLDSGAPIRVPPWQYATAEDFLLNEINNLPGGDPAKVRATFGYATIIAEAEKAVADGRVAFKFRSAAEMKADGMEFSRGYWDGQHVNLRDDMPYVRTLLTAFHELQHRDIVRSAQVHKSVWSVPTLPTKEEFVRLNVSPYIDEEVLVQMETARFYEELTRLGVAMAPDGNLDEILRLMALTNPAEGLAGVRSYVYHVLGYGEGEEATLGRIYEQSTWTELHQLDGTSVRSALELTEIHRLAPYWDLRQNLRRHIEMPSVGLKDGRLRGAHARPAFATIIARDGGQIVSGPTPAGAPWPGVSSYEYRVPRKVDPGDPTRVTQWWPTRRHVVFDPAVMDLDSYMRSGLEAVNQIIVHKLYDDINAFTKRAKDQQGRWWRILHTTPVKGDDRLIVDSFYPDF